jgi:hypothetical protein
LSFGGVFDDAEPGVSRLEQRYQPIEDRRGGMFRIVMGEAHACSRDGSDSMTAHGRPRGHASAIPAPEGAAVAR